MAKIPIRLPVEKLGSLGAVAAAAACPVCFPKLALLGAIFGLGGLAAYEAQLFVATQLLVLLALAWHLAAFRRHRRRAQLTTAVLSAAAVFAGAYAGWEWLAYAGLAGLVTAGIARLWRPSLRCPPRRLAGS